MRIVSISMKQLIICTIAVLLFYNPVKAQTRIEGFVEDDNGKPVPHANVSLYGIDYSSSTYTDSIGHFRLMANEQGKIKLKIYDMGFETFNRELTPAGKYLDLGIIILKDRPYVLKDVVVRSKAVYRADDKDIYMPTGKQKQYAIDGMALLRSIDIPQIDIDVMTDEVTSQNKKVTMMVNGQPVTDMSEVKLIRPKDVLRVEYENNPTGKNAIYDKVINIVTMHHNGGGYVNADFTQYLNYDYGNYLMLGQFYRSKSEHSFGYNFDYRYDNKIHNTSDETLFYPDLSTINETQDAAHSREKDRKMNYFYNYLLRDSDLTIHLKAGYMTNRPFTDHHFLTSYTGSMKRSLDSYELTNEKTKNPYLTFTIDKKFKHGNSLFMYSNFDYSNNKYSYGYQEDEAEQTSGFNNSSKENHYQYDLGVSYEKAFKRKWKLSASIFDFSENTNVKYFYSDHDNHQSKERFSESEILYEITASKKWKNLFAALTGGLSTLYYHQLNMDHRSMTTMRPRLTIRYHFNDKASLQYDAEEANSYPDLSLLNDVEQDIDFIQVNRGNPSLRIKRWFDNLLTFNYDTKNILFFTSFYSFLHSGPNVRQNVTYENNKFIHSYISDGYYNYINPEIGVTFRGWDNAANLKIQGGWKENKMTEKNAVNNNFFYIDSDLSLYYKAFACYVYYNSRDSRTDYEDLQRLKYSSVYGMTLSYKYHNLSLLIGTQNPFSSYHATSTTSLDNYKYFTDNESRQDGKVLYLKCSFNLNFGKKHNYSDVNTTKDANSAILKNSL